MTDLVGDPAMQHLNLPPFLADVGNIARALVLVEGQVGDFNGVDVELDLWHTNVFVNRSCLRLPAFKPAGVSVVCPVVKSFVNPLALGVGDPRGNNSQIITMPPAEQSAERRVVGESGTCVADADVNRPNMLEAWQIVRIEMREVLRDVGMPSQHGIGAFSAPVGRPVGRASAASRCDEMHSCIIHLPRTQASVAAPVMGCAWDMFNSFPEACTTPAWYVCRGRPRSGISPATGCRIQFLSRTTMRAVRRSH